MRHIIVILAAFLATAAAPPPPAPLEPYIRDGRFQPGDYAWMRGRFEDATAAEQEAFAQVRGWINSCFEAGQAENRAALRAMGVAEPKLERVGFRYGLCAQVASMPYGMEYKSFREFQVALAAATPVAETYLMAVDIAGQSRGPLGATLAEQLLARPLREQMLRKGLGWGEGELSHAPALPPMVKAIVRSRIAVALAEEDGSNTAWLKGISEKQGWPKISEVGERAASQAWLLVQHADADPVFQLQALRLMEPLLAKGEVSKQDYAYLYDRTMLKIAGKQRYATQVMCSGGRRMSQPLEDPVAIERLRAEAGLKPLQDYMTDLQKTAGDCPPDPPGAPAGK